MGQQTEKSRFRSRYSPGKYVTAAQYLIELICEKKAKQDHVELPLQFWNRPEWAAYFKKQLRQAHKLLKQYDIRAIIHAINSPKAWNIYSLYAPWLIPLIKAEQKKIDLHPRQDKTITMESTDTFEIKKPFSQNTLREQLDG